MNIVDMNKSKPIIDQLAKLRPGETLKLKGTRSKAVAQQLRKAGVELLAPVDRVRNFIIDSVEFEWVNIPYASAVKAGDASKAQRTIQRLT